MARGALFLDRDGVLNAAPVIDGRPTSPRSRDELIIMDTATRACELFKAAGLFLVGVTNQPDIARGKVSAAVVDEINDTIKIALGLDDIRTCPHDNADKCKCRKPAPGLIWAAAAAYGLDPASSIMVGDRGSDIIAGRRAGCKTVFINYSYQHESAEDADFICTNLLEAAPWILDNLKA